MRVPLPPTDGPESKKAVEVAQEFQGGYGTVNTSRLEVNVRFRPKLLRRRARLFEKLSRIKVEVRKRE